MSALLWSLMALGGGVILAAFLLIGRLRDHWVWIALFIGVALMGGSSGQLVANARADYVAHHPEVTS